MHYSFSTVLMTILASNLIIILITLCFRYEKLMVSVGYRLLAVFLVLTLIRFLLPFELSFTRTLYLPEFLSKYIAFFRHSFFQIGFWDISLWFIFECIWLIGALVCLYRHIRTHNGSARYIAAFGRDITGKEPVQTILAEICGKHKNPFRVTVIPDLAVPQIFGFLSPRILIPDYMDPDSEEFRFSLHHEAYHYFHHDLIIKEAVNLLCILYWWNPACRLFQKQVGLILEMHVDDSLVNRDSDVAKAYMGSLIHILESASDRQNPVPSDTTVA
ncbi:MAG: M56 family metallopeptidase, partial [Acetatifactor sp.]